MSLYKQLKNYPHLETFLEPWYLGGVYRLMKEQIDADIELTNPDHFKMIQEYADNEYDLCLRSEDAANPEDAEFARYLLNTFNGVHNADDVKRHKEFIQGVFKELWQIKRQLATDPAAMC